MQKSRLVDELHEYSAGDVARLFQVSESNLRALERAGYLTVAARAGATEYTYADVLILRLASALAGAKVATAQLVAAIGNVRATLPPGAVLTTMALSAAAEGRWQGSATQIRVASAAKQLQAVPLVQEAHAHYVRGLGLEESDLAAARDAYLDALRLHGQHVDARINLGRLLHLNGQFKAAEKVYRQAESAHALLSFNLASLLEDMDREEEAIVAYREALALDPQLHDAHFNLSRLHEKAKRPSEALRHLLAYRRHATKP